MVKNKLNKKAQSLPLNTIVIAILVIIVLLVIIVFFVNQSGKTGDTVNSLAGCDTSNPVLMGYSTVKTETFGAIKNTDTQQWERDGNKIECQSPNEMISIIPWNIEITDKENNVALITICCGQK